ncbi:hypothetical protein BKA82DRAFT_4185299 [Pisolithus tinctorius]|nr:hypothetical protein BKA82DRAFT_4185299 [Pisolithus tinctorius]
MPAGQPDQQSCACQGRRTGLLWCYNLFVSSYSFLLSPMCWLRMRLPFDALASCRSSNLVMVPLFCLDKLQGTHFPYEFNNRLLTNKSTSPERSSDSWSCTCQPGSAVHLLTERVPAFVGAVGAYSHTRRTRDTQALSIPPHNNDRRACEQLCGLSGELYVLRPRNVGDDRRWPKQALSETLPG